ncbi:MAG TPA: metallophosphoesterase N-terminal domain-containing protein [Phycisphaerae bacterium]|nr:metallophosphoesterase N-terminal domain-containing protein [Phycisphaerae bacterium]
MQQIGVITCILSVTCWGGPADQGRPATATGVVFHDSNRNGVRDPGEDGLKDIRVSNGREIVLTNQNGNYQLPVDDDTILFVIKPRGWMTPLSELNLPRFYYIHKPNGSPKLRYPGVAPTGPLPNAIDFPLYPQKEPDRFRVIVVGDTQPDSIEDINYLAHDVVEEVIGTEAAFGFTLGDLVNNRPNLFEPLSRTVAHIGLPWYNVLGNHDENYDAPDDRHADESFERVYGPSYYSFDQGPGALHRARRRDLARGDRDGEGPLHRRARRATTGVRAERPGPAAEGAARRADHAHSDHADPRA